MILRGAKELVQHNWSVDMGVSKSSGTPKSSILVGFSIINHPFWGTPIFGNIHIHVFLFVLKLPDFGFSRIRKANLFAKNVPKEQLLLGKEARLVATVVGLIFLTNHQGFVDSPFFKGSSRFWWSISRVEVIKVIIRSYSGRAAHGPREGQSSDEMLLQWAPMICNDGTKGQGLQV